MTRVKQLKMESLSYSSIFQIGDAKKIEPKADVLAVQKEGGISSDKGFELDQYPIFNTEVYPIQDPEIVTGEHCHYHSNISVSTIFINGVSSSSVVQLGSNKHINALSKIKHIRILKDN
ncbi:spore germination protein GerPE [Gracilibacillus caseinilyticus]|uniref:Spore germination protein GerPE n=1 Tax=Gracilibacillus caseinilyticus TaxID=2932256 RepID=A0ABY4ERC0_9BACI|nr:spore germination protein GerPE [Gracilibacillus caseinilyticus]UOQ46890.1 spore germination protein GerPE [Gracilibacillus caseinilyticus]